MIKKPGILLINVKKQKIHTYTQHIVVVYAKIVDQ